MKTIGHVLSTYIHISETFIHQQIMRNCWFHNVVFAKNIINEEIFPVKHLIPFDEPMDLLNLFSQYQVKLIHAHFGPSALRALPAKRQLKIPLLTFIHGFDAKRYPNENSQNLARYQALFEHGDVFAVPSEPLKKELINLGCPSHKVTVCHLGVDVDRLSFRPRIWNSDPIRLISVGRLVPKKGHHNLIEALSMVEKKMPKFELAIIGEGKERKNLEHLIQHYGLTNKIRLMGSRTHQEVIDELNRSHIFCLASVTDPEGDMEGLPISILEAQALGLPVVSTQHSGIPEGVIEGKSALLAKEADPVDLADKLLELMGIPDQWTVFGRAGREWVEQHFHAEKQAEELKKIYEKLMERT